jgi:hypothetical protein
MRTMLEQIAYHLPVANLRRLMQWGPSALLPGVCGSTLFEQQSYNLSRMGRRSTMEGRDLHLIFGNRSDVCAMSD